MNINAIAAKLMGIREAKSTSFVMSGVIREELGFEGYAEAFRRGWLQADMEHSGMVQITNNMGTVREMREMSAEYSKECKDRCGKCGENECTCEGRCKSCKGEKCTCESQEPRQPVSESAVIAQAHAFRTKNTLAEIATLGLGRQPDSASAPVIGLGAQSAQSAPTSAPASRPDPASPSRQQPLDIGLDVNVVENGKTYAGKVSQVKPDGKVRISFGGDKPTAERDYDKTEVLPFNNV